MRKQRPRKRRIDLLHHDIPTKANRILYLILIALSLIVFRIWYLSVIQYDQKFEESRRPQRKSIIEPAIRATICDRFDIPLAINKTSYQAAILYSELRDIPSITWQKDDSGKRIKIFKRREYIRQLAQLFGQELQTDPERIEDLIHAKASYYSQVPFVIKEEISEKEYYRLKMLEKDWPGLHVRRMPQRYYPQGKTGADIVGYMGAINRQEYEKILHEMKALEQFIKDRENGEEGDSELGFENTIHARKRLRELEEKAYTIHDYVGKTGIEAVFEQQLRGFYGKKNYYSDSKGNFLWELPGSRAPLPGHKVILTISSELQEYAEQLLAQNEDFRLVRKSNLGALKKTIIANKHPWIKGGAIIAMDPNNAQVIALASYPRFDPNDFIASGKPEQQKTKKHRINRWFENPHYIAQMWNMQQPLERERFDAKTGNFFEEQRWLSWSNYLDFVLPKESPLRATMDRIGTIHQAVELQRQAKKLRDLFPEFDLYAIINLLYAGDSHIPYRPLTKSAEKNKLSEAWQIHAGQALRIKAKLDVYFYDLPQNYDKVLAIDLCQLAVFDEAFNPELLQKVGAEKLDNHRLSEGALVSITALVKDMAKEIYHEHDFKKWRGQEEKEFLKQKRLEEKAAKVYPKPYIDYIDQKENQLFQAFWDDSKWLLIAIFLSGSDKPLQEQGEIEPYAAYFDRWHQEITNGAHASLDWMESYHVLQKSIRSLPADIAMQYLQSMRSYHELERPLFGRYRALQVQKSPLEKHLAAAFYPVYGYGYGRSHAYRQSTIQGSLFKIVTAYEALTQRYKRFDGKVDLNPLIISDQEFMKGNVRFMGYTEDGKPIPQLYKGGRLPRSLAHRNTGRVDLVRAFEVSSNPYFSMLAGDCLEDPEDLMHAASQFGYGCRTEIDLPGEIAGKVPKDVDTNRTGLYAMAIGQHSMVVTPLQTAVMLSAIANRGKVLKPKIIERTIGTQPMYHEDQIPSMPVFPYQDSLGLAGLDFPLFTAAFSQNQENLIKTMPVEVKRELFMPDTVRRMILRGLRASVQHTYHESLFSLSKLYKKHPEAISQLKALKDQLLGKTSTSEVVENIDLDLEEGTNIYTHVWFGCIAYDGSKQDQDKNAFIFRDEYGQPELIVVVYLRYGGYGKEAAPLAAQIVKKWREIKQKHAQAD